MRLPVYTLALALVLLAVRNLGGALVTVALAYALAYTVNPLLSRLERRGVPRVVGAVGLVALLLGVFALLFWTVASQVSSLVAGLPALLDSLPRLLERVFQRQGGDAGVEQVQGRLAAYLQEQVQALSDNIGPIVAQALAPNSYIYGQVTGVLNWLGQAGLILTLAVFFMLDYEGFGRQMLRLFPRRWQPGILAISEDVSVSVGSYIRSQLIMILVISALAGGGLLILKVPNALALGLLTGVLNMVPLVGMVLATIPALLQAVPQGTTTLLLVAGLFFSLNQVAWNVIAPMIMGRSVNMSPTVLLVAVILAGSLAGLPGAIVAVPVASLLQRWLQRYWLGSPSYEGRGRRGQTPPPPPARATAPSKSPYQMSYEWSEESTR